MTTNIPQVSQNDPDMEAIWNSVFNDPSITNASANMEGSPTDVPVAPVDAMEEDSIQTPSDDSDAAKAQANHANNFPNSGDTNESDSSQSQLPPDMANSNAMSGLASSPNGYAIMQQLANQYLSGVQPGGPMSVEAQMQQKSNLNPIMAAREMHQLIPTSNGNLGVGVMNTGKPDLSDLGPNPADMGSNVLANLTGAGSAAMIPNQISSMQNLPALIQKLKDPTTTPAEKAQIAQELQAPYNPPQIQAFGKSILAQPDVAAYGKGQETAETGKATALNTATDAVARLSAKTDQMMPQINNMKTLATQFPSGFLNQTEQQIEQQIQSGTIDAKTAQAYAAFKSAESGLALQEYSDYLASNPGMRGNRSMFMAIQNTMQSPNASMNQKVGALDQLADNLSANQKQAIGLYNQLQSGKVNTTPTPVPTKGVPPVGSTSPNAAGNTQGNTSGMATIKGPDGKVWQIPQNNVQAALSRGATLVQ